MSCCATLAGGAVDFAEAPDLLLRQELRRAGETLPDGRMRYLLSVPAIRCGACIAAIEDALAGCEGVTDARVNLTLRRVAVMLDAESRDPLPMLAMLERLGYPATAIEPGGAGDRAERRESVELLKALAVAGFAAGNIMLMSVSVWSGAGGATRDLFHLLSALIAVPVVAYSGRPFFGSALAALRARRLNMDVPISLGVLLALGLSVSETMRGGDEAYFDAAVTLLFFLLIGRYLDRLMRERARSAVVGLARLAARGAMRVGDDGRLDYVPLDEIKPGMVLRIAAGERLPVDACVVGGRSDLDRSLVTGESLPAPAGIGDVLEAGVLNLTGPLDVRALRSAGESFLAEVTKLLAAAEHGKGRYVRIADRASRLYAPVVHLLAAGTFVGWMAWTGSDWHTATYVAVTVLIITCPCALGLAVPVVHVVAAGRLFEAGILMKDGSALERLAEADRVVFDKTGTLTTGQPRIVASDPLPASDRGIARALALHSAHPVARAVAEHLQSTAPATLAEVREVPGFGVEGRARGMRARLGRADWVAELAGPGQAPAVTAFAVEGGTLAGFSLAESLRPEAARAVAELSAAGLEPELLSGDAEAPVQAVARQLGIARVSWRQTPTEKIARLEALRAEGHRVLMVGDGLNDAPALVAAHVSMAPGSASDAGRLAADFVFTRDSLVAVAAARTTALRAARLVRQNIGLAVVYNFVAVPLAVAGQVTPLIAAVAMSLSSMLVVANSLRLAGPTGPRLTRARRHVEAPA